MTNRMQVALAAAVFSVLTALAVTRTPAPTLTVTDNSGSGQQVYWGIIGLGATDTANWYYLSPTTGAMVKCYAGQTLDTIFQPLSATATITLPATSSGRVYFSLGRPLTSSPFASAANIVLPNFVGKDPNTGTIYDKVEFTYKPSGPGKMAFVNTTLVDYVSIPFGVTLTGRQKGVQNLGILTSSREDMMTQMAGLSMPYAALVVTGTAYAPTTKYIRAVSPIAPSANQKAKGQGLKFDADRYYGAYIKYIWGMYASTPWDIDLTQAYGITLSGKVKGKDFVFTDSNSNTYTIGYPSGFDLLGCTGVFVPVTWGAGVYPQVDGIVKRTVAAAMNRAVAQVTATGKCETPRYQRRPYNEYAKVIHANSLNGLNYAFPYDDVCDGSSGMGDTKPTNVSITLLPWAGQQ